MILAAFVALDCAEKPSLVKKGMVDLRSHDFSTNGPVVLVGEWEFAWKKFIEPRACSGAPAAERGKISSYHFLPGPWNGKIVGNRILQGSGFASYRLCIWAQPGQELALAVPEISTAYALLVNGLTVRTGGQVGADGRSELPFYSPGVAAFTSTGPAVEIILRVSNFNNSRGGAWLPIHLGTERNIRSKIEREQNRKFLVLGGIMVLLLLFFTLLVLRPGQYGLLFFIGFCGLIALRVLVTGQHYLNQLFPSLPWEWEVKMELATFYLGVLCFSGFLFQIYPAYFAPGRDMRVSRFVFRAIFAVCAIFTATLLLPWMPLVTSLRVYFQYFTIFIILQSLTVLAFAAARGEDGARTYLAGGIFLALTVVNDILDRSLLYRQYLAAETGYLAPLGALGFIFAQAVVLIRRFIRFYERSMKSFQESSRRHILENVEMSQKLHIKQSTEELNKIVRAHLSEKNENLADAIKIAEEAKAQTEGRLEELRETELELALIKNSRDLKKIFESCFQAVREQYGIRGMKLQLLMLNVPAHESYIQEAGNPDPQSPYSITIEQHGEEIAMVHITPEGGSLSRTIVKELHIYFNQFLTSLIHQHVRRELEDTIIRLADTIGRLDEKIQQTEKDLNIARAFQTSLLPAAQNEQVFEGIKVNRRYEPAGKLSGDFFDYFYDEEQKQFGFFICDVEGHGAASALQAGIIAFAVRKLQPLFLSDPAELLRTLSDVMNGALETYLFSAVAGVIDTRTGQLRYANAGHSPQYMLMPNGILRALTAPGGIISSRINKHEAMKALATPPSNLEENIAPGDRILLFTDCLAEARNTRGELLQSEGVERLFSQYSGENKKDFCNRIYRSALHHAGTGSLDDDFTLLAVEYTGPGAS